MRKFLFVFFGLTILSSGLFAQEANAQHKKNDNLDNGLAIQGYDPVAYFRQHKAVKGNKQLQFSYQDAVYCFATADYREEFKKDPAKYEPQYGGWCAYAMGAKGEKVSVDPETFKIIDGKLYLFYNHFFNNTLTSWNKDEANLKNKADANWQKIIR